MAVFDAILGFDGTSALKTTALAASASSAEIVIGAKTLFAIHGTGAFHLKMGNAGMAAAAATDMLLPANSVITLDMTSQFGSIRVFNSTAAAIDVYVQKLSRH